MSNRRFGMEIRGLGAVIGIAAAVIIASGLAISGCNSAAPDECTALGLRAAELDAQVEAAGGTVDVATLCDIIDVQLDMFAASCISGEIVTSNGVITEQTLLDRQQQLGCVQAAAE